MDEPPTSLLCLPARVERLGRSQELKPLVAVISPYGAIDDLEARYAVEQLRRGATTETTRISVPTARTLIGLGDWTLKDQATARCFRWRRESGRTPKSSRDSHLDWYWCGSDAFGNADFVHPIAICQKGESIYVFLKD